MSLVGRLAALLDSIPFVQNSTDRDTKYASPDTSFRVENLATGYIERYDGANWVQGAPNYAAGPLISVRAKNAKGDGTTDDQSAFASADTAMQAQAIKGHLLIPAGTYKIGSNLTLASDVVFQPGAQLQPATGVVVTFNGKVMAPRTQIVTTGAGTLAFAATSVPHYYPQWWGAKGDGTDASTAVSAALDVIGAAGGGNLRFSPGSFPINTTITKSTTNGYNNIVLEGSGWKTVLSKSTAGDMFQFTAQNQGIVARDMEISLGSGVGWGININNCPNSRFQNIEFVGGSSSAGFITGTNNSHSCVVENCYGGSLIGTGFYFDTTCGGVKVLKNRVDGVASGSPLLPTTGSIGVRACGPGTAIIGNTLETLDVIISLQDGAQGLEISGNHAEFHNKFIDASTTTFSYAVVVKGNSTSAVQGPPQSPCDIDMVNCSGWTVQGNYLNSAHSSGGAIRVGNGCTNNILGPNVKGSDANFVVGTGAATQIRYENGAVIIPSVRNLGSTLTYSASITPNASAAKWNLIPVTDANAFTVNAPSSDTDSSHTQELVIEIWNNTAGAIGACTFSGAIYVLTNGTWVQPLAGKHRWIKFERNLSGLYIETGRAASDY